MPLFRPARRLAGLFLAWLLLGWRCAAAEVPVELLVGPCAACHGRTGVGAAPAVPNIAGQSAEYLRVMLRDFADEERIGSVMGGIARGYSAAERAALADHFSRLPRGSPKQAVDEQRAARGRRVHEANCERCHKDGGRRFEYESTAGPVLAGQWLDYLAQSIQQFLVWSRQTPSEMGVKLLSLESGDIEALAHFYASQR